MARHIKSLNIDTFRGITNLDLNELADINILTGDNNGGKTSVLELLESANSPESAKIWNKIVDRKSNSSMSGYSAYNAFKDLFNINNEIKQIKYNFRKEDCELIEVKIVGKESKEKLTTGEKDKISLPYMNGFFLNADMVMEDDGRLHNVEKIELEFNLNGVKKNDFSLYNFQNRYLVEDEMNPQFANVIYISPTQHAESVLYLNDVLNEPILYEEMLNVLKEFDDGIISINMNDNVYKILSKNNAKALPLNVYGDGMKKAVLLMSAVVLAKDGILLLDEFETAIHTSAMNKVFQWILKTCMKLNIQLFLTSHSEEAIDKILKCCPQFQDKMKVFTLYQKKDRTVARELTGEKAIEVKEQMGLELR